MRQADRYNPHSHMRKFTHNTEILLFDPLWNAWSTRAAPRKMWCGVRSRETTPRRQHHCRRIYLLYIRTIAATQYTAYRKISVGICSSAVWFGVLRHTVLSGVLVLRHTVYTRTTVLWTQIARAPHTHTHILFIIKIQYKIRHKNAEPQLQQECMFVCFASYKSSKLKTFCAHLQTRCGIAQIGRRTCSCCFGRAY